MLGVCGTSLVLPGWLVLRGTVGTGEIQTLVIRHYNVIPDLSGQTHTPWTFDLDLNEHRDFRQSTVLHSRITAVPVNRV